MADQWRNWTRLESVRPARVAVPGSVSELAAVVKAAARDGLKVRAVGSGHSFNDIAVAPDVQLDLRGLRGVLAADSATGLVTVAGGTPLYELSPALWDLGLAMPNLGDIDRQTISGALSTGTHGTGTTVAGSLSAQVRGLELVLADGAVVQCGPGEPLFEAARVGLGAFGVITAVTLQCVPAFHLRSAERPMPLAEAVERLLASGDAEPGHPEFFLFPHTDTVLWKYSDVVEAGTPPGPQPRFKAFVDDEVMANGLLGAVMATTALVPRLIRPVNRVLPTFYTNREYVDRSYHVFAHRRRVRFREGEYAVPLEAMPSVLADLQAWLAKPGNQVGFPMEVRVGPPEEAWLGTAHGRRTAWVAVQTHWRQPHTRYFAEAQRIVRAHEGRPHWGKLHDFTRADLSQLYPRFDDVLAVRDSVDPGRLFANAYVERVFGA
ncbi:D-arabinono-1,4-lactone oxidase [Spongisporangium articulatum]|uniref:D-arabinono-1,4-lactone oxidase n=1 Tax=Spongisporangium articulatum TaxID=3362603 RepID=A0ABW8AIW0_9ACTN